MGGSPVDAAGVVAEAIAAAGAAAVVAVGLPEAEAGMTSASRPGAVVICSAAVEAPDRIVVEPAGSVVMVGGHSDSAAEESDTVEPEEARSSACRAAAGRT